MTQANSTIAVFLLDVDASGGISGWNVNTIIGGITPGDTLTSFVLTNGIYGVGDDSGHSSDYPNIDGLAWTDSPGKWSGPVVPEPASVLLLGCGLAALAGMLKSRH
jgi:hypothetical protein